MSALQRDETLAAGLLVVASALLTAVFLAPSPAVLSFDGTTVTADAAGRYFGLRDVVVIAVAAATAGGSATYLLRPDADQRGTATAPDRTPAGDAANAEPADDLLDARREEWHERMERLTDNERAVYGAVLDADGVLPQSDIVEATDLSKATVSRTLDSLEAKELVERRRRGVGNVVWLR